MRRDLCQRLFIDMDGVLVDFNGPVLRKYGKSPEPPEMWTIYEACGVDRNTLFNDMSYDEWLGLPKTPECDQILEICTRAFDPRNIFILSSPLFHACDPKVLAAKHEWIWTHMPEPFRHQSFIGVSKFGAAHPNSVLLDDHSRQTTEFFSEGGSALLLPRKWNTPNWDRDLGNWLETSLDIWRQGAGHTYHITGHSCDKKAIEV